MTQASWAAPLLLLPGVALLLIATVHRFSQLQNRLRDTPEGDPRRTYLDRRARLFHGAFLGMYAGIACFLAASLVGAGLSMLGGPASTVTLVLTCLGILFVFVAIVFLGLEVLELAEHPPLVDDPRSEGNGRPRGAERTDPDAGQERSKSG